MNERRTKRSAQKSEALQLLLSAVKARSEVTSIAIIDGGGMVVSGMGTAQELAILGAVAAPVAAGRISPMCERLTAGTDVLATTVKTPLGTMVLAALGSRVGRMRDAARGVERILRVA
jgi:hypothetical protein